jgi:hypothetical protein
MAGDRRPGKAERLKTFVQHLMRSAAVTPALGARSVNELIVYGKSNPGKLRIVGRGRIDPPVGRA